MAFTSILRKSAFTLVPAAARRVRTQPNNQASVFAVINRAADFTLSHYSFTPRFSGPSVRRYSSSVSREKRDTDGALLKVLQSEIECAEESVDDNMDENIPSEFPFQIEDVPGQQTVILKGSYEGDNITVEVHMPDLGVDEDGGGGGDDDDGDSGNSSENIIPLGVTISKKSGEGPILEFSVTAYPNEISMDSFSVKKTDAAEDTAYEGPDFHDLDENLQKALHKYLAVRGIRPSTTSFLHEYMIKKDSKEYLFWLKKVKGFIEA